MMIERLLLLPGTVREVALVLGQGLQVLASSWHASGRQTAAFGVFVLVLDTPLVAL
jgi:hypothetical protein